MRTATLDRLVLAGFIVLAVALWLSTAEYRGIAQTTSARYVRFLAAMLGGLAALQLVTGWRNGDPSPADLFGRAGRFSLLLGGLIVFALAFEPLGFFLSGAIFVPAIAFGLGARNWLAVILTTLGVLGAVWLLFVRVLAVNLPGLG